MKNNIDLDKLKGIIELKKSLPPTDYQNLLNSLPGEESKRLKHLELGLSKEDEFILISKLFGKCITIQKVDQSKYGVTDNSIPPDLIATYNLDTSLGDKENQITMFVEVKRCSKKYWKISNRDFDRRVKFAKINGIPLFFAINFTYGELNLWTLLPAEFIKKNNFRIYLMRWCNNLFDYIIGNLTIHFKDFDLTKIYSKSAKSILVHPEYGGIEKIIISANDKQFEFSGNDPINLLFRVLNSTEKERIINEKIIIKRYYDNQIISLYQLLIGCIKVLYGDEENFSIGKYLKKIVDGETEIINSNFGYYMLDKMEEIGIAQHFIWNPDIFKEDIP
jgi:Holliday junction resolvase